MGDRFLLTLKCAYCSAENPIYYAPTCGMYDFTCKVIMEKREIGTGKITDGMNFGCGKINFVMADFSVKKAEEVTEEDVVSAFEMATTASHSLQSIKAEAKRYLKNLKKRISENDRRNSNPK